MVIEILKSSVKDVAITVLAIVRGENLKIPKSSELFLKKKDYKRLIYGQGIIKSW